MKILCPVCNPRTPYVTRVQILAKRYKENGPSEDYRRGYDHGYGDGIAGRRAEPDVRPK